MTAENGQFALEIDAHSIDDEFEKTIDRDYGVRITDRSGEPWAVVFQGTREQLTRMVRDHWGDQISLNDRDFVPVV